MKNCVLLIFIILSFPFLVGWTYKWDFEDGTDEAECDSYSQGTSPSILHDADNHGYVKFDSARDNGGTMSCRYYFVPGDDNGWESKAVIDFPSVVLTNGMHHYMHMDLYYATGGCDWTHPGETKLMRIMTSNTDSSNSIMLTYATTNPRIYCTPGSGVTDDFNGSITPFKSTNTLPNFVPDQWNTIDVHYYLQANNTGYITATVNGVTKTTSNIYTLYYSGVDYMTLGYIFSQWNGGIDGGGYAWVDNVYYSNEQSYDDYIGGTTPSDLTDPIISNLSPDSSATGVLTTANVLFTVSDTGDGVNIATVTPTVEGINYINQLTYSGTSASYDCTISNVLTTATYLQDININIAATDNNGNSLSYDYGFTIQPQPATPSTTVFSTGTAGDRSNYTELNSSRWATTSESGDVIYKCIDTSYASPGTGAFGEYTLFTTPYSQFDLTFQVRTDENLTTNANADFGVIVGYQSADEYVTINFNKNASSNAIGKYLNGAWTSYDIAGEALISDTNWHTVRVVLQNTVLSVYLDDVLKMETNSLTIPFGKIGFASYNDAFSIDDVVITNLQPTPQTSTPPCGRLFGTGNIKLNGNSTINFR